MTILNLTIGYERGAGYEVRAWRQDDECGHLLRDGFDSKEGAVAWAKWFAHAILNDGNQQTVVVD